MRHDSTTTRLEREACDELGIDLLQYVAARNRAGNGYAGSRRKCDIVIRDRVAHWFRRRGWSYLSIAVVLFGLESHSTVFSMVRRAHINERRKRS